MSEERLNPIKPAVRRNSWTALPIGFFFLVGYGCYVFFSAFWVNRISRFIMDVEWSDWSVAWGLLAYLFVMLLPFLAYGIILDQSDLKRHVLILTVLPPAALGSIVWILTYTSQTGSLGTINDLSWLFFWPFILWANPLVDILPVYLEDPNRVKLAAWFISLLPSLFAAAGCLLAVWWKQSKAGRAILCWGGASIPVALIVILVVSLNLPRNAYLTVEEYPRVDGATAALPFGRLLVQRVTGVNKNKAQNLVRFYTTHEAYVNLIEGKADIIFAAGPSDEEQKLAESKGINLKLTPIGKDAFVFLVHKKNPVQGLKVEELQGIYTGKITNWKELGGEDERIIAFQREKNSGSQTYMEQKVMKGLTFADPPMEKKNEGMGGLIDAVADYANSSRSLGYSFLYYATQMHKREEVKLLTINGVEPNQENIRSGAYPYTAVLYAVTRGEEPPGSSTEQLLSWILSEEGTRAIEEGGFVPYRE